MPADDAVIPDRSEMSEGGSRNDPAQPVLPLQTS